VVTISVVTTRSFVAESKKKDKKKHHGRHAPVSKGNSATRVAHACGPEGDAHRGSEEQGKDGQDFVGFFQGMSPRIVTRVLVLGFKNHNIFQT